MFKRNVLVVALLAVVLLSSLMDGRLSTDKPRRRRHAPLMSAVAVVDPTMRLASLSSLKSPSASVVSADDASFEEAGRIIRKRRIKRTADQVELNQIAGSIAGIDPT